MGGSHRSEPQWKLISFLKRRPELTAEEFAARWREVHAPLMRQQSGFWGHVRRYIQNYALSGSDSPIGVADSHDGVSEIWFESLSELRTAFSEPDFEAVKADAREFVDFSHTVSWVAEVVHIRGPVPTRIKLFGAGRAREGLTRAEAQAYWREQHPEVIAREAPGHWATMYSYDQAHTRAPGPLPLETITDAYDICAEVGMDSAEAMQAAYTRQDYLEHVRPDELRFASVADSIACAARPVVIYDDLSAPA